MDVLFSFVSCIFKFPFTRVSAIEAASFCIANSNALLSRDRKMFVDTFYCAKICVGCSLKLGGGNRAVDSVIL